MVPEKEENRVAEYDSKGTIIWQAKYPEPVAAARLPNGNIVVTSFNDPMRQLPTDRLVPAAEFDRNGKVVWEHRGSSRVTRVYRR